VSAAIAKAQELAGDRIVSVNAGVVGSQLLAAGLVDEVAMDVVPVVFGSGKPYFANIEVSIVVFDSTVAPYHGRAVYAVGEAREVCVTRGSPAWSGHPFGCRACSRFDWWGPESHVWARRVSTGCSPRRRALMYAWSAASRTATSGPLATAPWPGTTTSTCLAASPSRSSAAS
jgi:hypothetical protein